MKAKVKYDVLKYNGKRSKITKNYEVPEFEEKRFPSFLDKNREVVVTVEQQIDEYISDLDKADFMEEKDLHLIFDWEIVSAKKESRELVIKEKKPSKDEQIKVFLSIWEAPENIKADFTAVYLKMKPSLKGLSIEKIVDVVISTIGVSYSSINATFDRMNEEMEEWRKQKGIKRLSE